MSNVQDLLSRQGAGGVTLASPRAPVPSNLTLSPPPPASHSARRIFVWSIFLIVIVPTLAVFLWQSLFLSVQYQSETQIVLRGDLAKTGNMSSLPGPMSAVGALNRTQEAYILTRYVPSRAFIDDASKTIDFAALYGASSIDAFSRLPQNADKEALTDYWQSHVRASTDPLSGIVTLDITAFSPDDARNLSLAAIKFSQQTLNHLLQASRQDAVRIASQERERAAEDLAAIRNQLETFRQKAGVLDPSGAGSQSLDIIFQRRTDRSHLSAELQAALATLSANAPQIKAMQARLAALDKQIEALSNALSKDRRGNNLATLIADYDALDMKRQFAEDNFTRNELALVRTQAEVDSWHVDVIPMTGPALPQDVSEPQPLENAGITLAIALTLWLIFVLVGESVLEHRQ